MFLCLTDSPLGLFQSLSLRPSSASPIIVHPKPPRVIRNIRLFSSTIWEGQRTGAASERPRNGNTSAANVGVDESCCYLNDDFGALILFTRTTKDTKKVVRLSHVTLLLLRHCYTDHQRTFLIHHHHRHPTRPTTKFRATIRGGLILCLPPTFIQTWNAL